jgi:hypothetical protein
MKFILEFNSYKKPAYKAGDIVLVEYWYLDEPSCDPRLHREFPYTPVKILEKLSRVSFKVSHDVPGSKIKNAPDEIVKTTDIIDLAR